MSIDPFAVISVVGSRDALTVSDPSRDKSVLLIICIDASEATERETVYEIVESFESILKDVTGFIYESTLEYVAAVFKVLLCRH